MKKRILSFVLALIICVSIAVPALAGGEGLMELAIELRFPHTEGAPPLSAKDLVGDFVFTNENGHTFTIPSSLFQEKSNNTLRAYCVFGTEAPQAPNELLAEGWSTYTLTKYPSLPTGYSFDESGYSWDWYYEREGEEFISGPPTVEFEEYEPYYGAFFYILNVNGGASSTPEAPSAWAVEQVNAAIAANLVPVALQSKYTQATTRAEFCALAVTLYENIKGEISGRTKFNDTNDVNVEKAASIGVTSGTGNNNFSPNNPLTREQAATMLSRLADAVGSPLTGHGQGDDFNDNASISDWAVGAVKQVQASGIMSGVGNNTFAPKNPYTREQSIVTVLRLYEIVYQDDMLN